MPWVPTHVCRSTWYPVRLVSEAEDVSTYDDIYSTKIAVPTGQFRREYRPIPAPGQKRPETPKISQRRGASAALKSKVAAMSKKLEQEMTSPFRKISQAELDAAKSPNGGYTKAALMQWGIEWPPKKGWQQALLHGTDPNNPVRVEKAQIEGDTELLERVVAHIIEQGHAVLLHGIPGLLDRFNARLPSAAELAARAQPKSFGDDPADFFV